VPDNGSFAPFGGNEAALTSCVCEQTSGAAVIIEACYKGREGCDRRPKTVSQTLSQYGCRSYRGFIDRREVQSVIVEQGTFFAVEKASLIPIFLTMGKEDCGGFPEHSRDEAVSPKGVAQKEDHAGPYWVDPLGCACSGRVCWPSCLEHRT